jgi:MurNAc alpha-1-phosphate uridylyltransferase
MASAYRPAEMDALLLLARAAGSVAITERGDFLWPRGETLRRRGERDVAPYIYAGVQIVSPGLFAASPPPPFSMNLLWDQAIEKKRLGAIVHDGVWFHLTTPDDLARAEAVLEAREVGNTT